MEEEDILRRPQMNWQRQKEDSANNVYTRKNITYIHTYHSRSIPEGVAVAPWIFLRDTHVLPKLFSYD
jgi:hypothetical protein